MSTLTQQILLSFLLVTFLLPVSAVRYMGDPKDAAAIKTLITILKVQGQEIEKILSMLSGLQKEKARLDERKKILGKAMHTLKADQALLDAGKLAKKSFADKWQTGGHDKRLKKDYAVFQGEVKKFNKSINAFNVAAKKMKHVLKKRTPGQIGALRNAMRNLVEQLQAALKEGNYERALFVARKSDVAKEFGYSEK